MYSFTLGEVDQVELGPIEVGKSQQVIKFFQRLEISFCYFAR